MQNKEQLIQAYKTLGLPVPPKLRPPELESDTRAEPISATSEPVKPRRQPQRQRKPRAATPPSNK